MQTGIKTRSDQTKEYQKYILNELIKRSPLSIGEVIDIEVTEGATPFPTIAEMPTPPSGKVSPIHDMNGKEIGKAYQGSATSESINAQIADYQSRFDSRRGAVWDYTSEMLFGMCRLHIADFSDEPPVRAKISITITDPEKIYQMAEWMGGDTLSTTQAALPNKEDKEKQHKTKPHLIDERGCGFLIVGSGKSKKVKIGRVSAKPFRLLQSLFEPRLGLAKTIDAVYEAIRSQTSKDSATVNEPYLGPLAKVEQIKNATRKLYTTLKIAGHRGVLKFHIKDRKCWAEWKF